MRVTQEIRRIAQHAALYCRLRYDNFATLLAERLGEHRFDVDLREQVVRFENDTDAVVGRAELVASVAAKPPTLLWGWAAPMAHLTGDDPLAGELREYGDQHGLCQFVTDEVGYAWPIGADQGTVIRSRAVDAGQAAVEVLGSGYLPYVFPIGGGSQATVMISELSVPVPEVSLQDVIRKLPRLLTEGQGFDELAWSLDGLVRLRPGWTLNVAAAPAEHDFTLTDETGEVLTINLGYDEHNRPVRFTMNSPANSPEPGPAATPDQ